MGIGARNVTEQSDDGWQLACSVFWIDDQERERRDGEEVVNTTRRTRGLDCRASPRSDPASVRWRFRQGIAPPRDSLALLYDSLAAARSPLVSPSPPMTLERLSLDTGLATRYEIGADDRSPNARPTSAERLGLVARLSFSRDTTVIGTLIASPADMGQLLIDIGPAATTEEKRVLRLLAAVLLLSLP